MRRLSIVLIGIAAITMLCLEGCSQQGLFGLATPGTGTGTSTWKLIGPAGFSTDQANTVSMVLDGSGNPYVAYSDVAYGGELTVMHYNGTSWSPVGPIASPSPTMTSSPVNGEQLAIDSNGTIYLAYGVGGTLYVDSWNGTAWSALGGGSVSTNLLGNGLFSLGASGTTLYVAFADSSGATSGGVTCEKWNGSTWSALSGGTNFPASIGSLSLAVESGTPSVAFTDNANSKAPSVMQYSGTAWAYLGSANFSSVSAVTISMAFEGTTPTVAFAPSPFSGSTAPPVLMSYSGGSWQQANTAGLDNVSTNGYSPQVELVPANGALLFAYYAETTTTNSSTTGIFVYSNSSGTWTPFSNGNMNTPYALTADASGAPVVAYADSNVYSRLSVATP